MKKIASDNSIPEWVFNGKDCLSFTFDNKRDFTANYTIKWRGQLFHIKIAAPKRIAMLNLSGYHVISEKTEYKLKVTNLYNSRKTNVKRPLTFSKTHILEIVCEYNYCTIIEEEKPVRLELMDEVRFLLNGGKPGKEVKGESFVYENPFEILEASDVNVFEDSPKKEISMPSNNNRITLYEYSNGDEKIISQIYFFKHSITLTYMKPGNFYAKDKYIIVNRNNLNRLFSEFKIKDENRAELLLCMLNTFSGEYSYWKFKRFLEDRKISYKYW